MVKNKVCRPYGHGGYHCYCIQPSHRHGFWPSTLTVEEEVKELEEYREALEKELEKVRKRLEALKR